MCKVNPEVNSMHMFIGQPFLLTIFSTLVQSKQPKD